MTNNSKIDKFTRLIKIKDKKKECSICFDNFVDEDPVELINCKHIYHKKCIKKC